MNASSLPCAEQNVFNLEDMENNHEDHAFKFTEDSVFIITYSMGKLDHSMLNYEIQYVIF